MKNKKRLTIVIIAICVALIGFGATYSLLVASSRPVTNVMTVGDVNITLTETKGTSFKLIPGVTHEKDPTVTVQSGSLNCWIFIKEEASADLHQYASYEIDSGWTPLEGEAGVYYRKYYTSANDVVYPIIKGNVVAISEDLTEEKMSFIHSNPTLSFTAYAVQAELMDTPDIAWDTIIIEKGE